MESNTPRTEERKAYTKPEAELVLIRVNENIAYSGILDDAFDSEEDFFG